MQRAYSLKRRGQFQYVYRRGKRVSSAALSLLYVPSGRLNIGFSVSKKVGNAVTRNLMKRRLREMIRPILKRLRPGLYVVVIREPATQQSFATLSQNLQSLLSRQRLILPNPNPITSPRATPTPPP